MSINSRSKGQRGERQWRDEIRAAGWRAERGQQRSGSPDSPDVKTDMPIHFEVKAVESLNVWKAVEQARTDSGGKPWAVAHTKNRQGWLVTLDAGLFFSLCRDGIEGLKTKRDGSCLS
jgi:Holliday junction resolvase